MFKTCDWTLLYSLNTDGVSMGTFYERCRSWKITLIVIRDKGGFIFGAFCTEKWVKSTKFYGTGETFLFTFRDENKP